MAESLLYSLYYTFTSDLPRIVENLHAHWYVGAQVVPVLITDTFLLALLLVHLRGRGPLPDPE